MLNLAVRKETARLERLKEARKEEKFRQMSACYKQFVSLGTSVSLWPALLCAGDHVISTTDREATTRVSAEASRLITSPSRAERRPYCRCENRYGRLATRL